MWFIGGFLLGTIVGGGLMLWLALRFLHENFGPKF